MKTITYTIREIVYDTGKTEMLCMNGNEYAGFLRRKGIKKKILTNKRVFTLSINLKNHLQK